MAQAPSSKKRGRGVGIGIAVGIITLLLFLIPVGGPIALAYFKQFAGWVTSSTQTFPPVIAHSYTQQATPAPTTPQCPGQHEVVEVSSTAKIINPRALCFVKWRVENGRVELIGTDGKVIRVVGPEGGHFSEYFESVRAVGGTVVFRYMRTTS